MFTVEELFSNKLNFSCKLWNWLSELCYLPTITNLEHSTLCIYCIMRLMLLKGSFACCFVMSIHRRIFRTVNCLGWTFLQLIMPNINCRLIMWIKCSKFFQIDIERLKGNTNWIGNIFVCVRKNSMQMIGMSFYLPSLLYRSNFNRQKFLTWVFN